MNKKQAIKLLSKDTSINEIQKLRNKGLSQREIIDTIQEAIDICIVSTEKQIAKKPKDIVTLEGPFDDEVDVKMGNCAICGFDVHSDISEYCPNCGQKQDWRVGVIDISTKL